MTGLHDLAYPPDSVAAARGPAVVLPLPFRAHQGSEQITEWCPTCLERVVPMRDGTCGWCDAPLEAQDLVQAGEAAAQGLVTARVGTPKESNGDKDVPAPRIPRRRDRRHRHGRPYTDEQIIARIRLWAELTGEPPTKAAWTTAKLRKYAANARKIVEKHLRTVALYELGDFPSETTVRDRFGSMNGALVAAGFEPRSAGRPNRPENDPPIPKPKVGGAALCAYYSTTVEERLSDGGGPGLKKALYDLALSAILEADRIRGIVE